jgi:hypothetical protein
VKLLEQATQTNKIKIGKWKKMVKWKVTVWIFDPWKGYEFAKLKENYIDPLSLKKIILYQELVNYVIT